MATEDLEEKINDFFKINNKKINHLVYDINNDLNYFYLCRYMF